VLVDPSRTETLAAAVVELCGDEALRGRLAAAARAAIARRGFTWLNNARRVASLIAEQGAQGAARRAL
jgi:glycosyltransferase involved in cell wall biosynthesis